jgi:hypothetical protein
MQTDPFVEYQRLTENYSKMYDQELLNLAANTADLTEQARQVLSGEMRKRGLQTPQAAGTARKLPGQLPDPMPARASARFGVLARAPEPVPDTPNFQDESGDESGESDEPREYTWKTVLCECEDREEAWQICEMLRRAGIESWIDGPRGSYSPYSGELDLRTPRVLVAADQIDQAREIAARPIPQEIVEQSKMQTPEFEPPVCPKCGAEDPVLENADPANAWKCEACEYEWTEAPMDQVETPGKAES